MKEENKADRQRTPLHKSMKQYQLIMKEDEKIKKR